jgi:arylsulfatase A-like enzyme
MVVSPARTSRAGRVTGRGQQEETTRVRRFVAVLALAICAAPAGRAAEPRNVVVIFTDDQAWDTIGHVNPLVSTPNLDELIADGTWFANAAVSTSVCPASRVSLITGLHYPAHRFTFSEPRPDFSILRMSYPAVLRANGYYSGFIGKNGMRLDTARADLLFDEWKFHTREYFNRRGVHLTDRLGSAAKRFIRAREGAGPWSLLLWLHAPHANDDAVGDEEFYEPPTRYEKLYDDVVFPPRPGSEEWPERPDLFEDTLNREQAGVWQPDRYQRNMRRYHAMVRGIDDAVGQVRRALRATGQADNTLIVFLSDNGLYRGERGFGGKWLGHEASVRVPMIVFDPAREGGGTVEALTSNVDVAPTVLERLGFEVPAWMQGSSLAPWLDGGQAENWRDDLFIEHSWSGSFDPDGPRLLPRTRGVRTEQFKYLEYPESGYRELYDLTADPDELVNLAGEPTHATSEVALRRLARQRARDYAAAVFADGFETGDATRWSSQRGLRPDGSVARRGLQPHPWALTPSLREMRPAFAGLTLPPRGKVSVSFLFSARTAATSGPTQVGSLAKGSDEVALLLDVREDGSWLILRGGEGGSASLRLTDDWTPVEILWDGARGAYTLASGGEVQGEFATSQRAVRKLRFGLPAGGGGGSGRVGFDEFVVLTAE